MRKRILLLLPLLATLLIAACGGTKTVTVHAPAKTPGVEVVPETSIRETCPTPTPEVNSHGELTCIPQTGVRPEGFASESPPAALLLFGSSIHLSPNGARFIESFEGFASCPYFDSFGGVWTRGYGETEGISRGSACISRSFGQRNLTFRAERFYGWAIKGLGVSFNQNQVDALFSFTWNLGAGIFTGSLRSAIQRHNPFPLLAYDHAGGVVLAGLSRRRHAEVALFLKPAHEETPAQHRARVKRERTARLHVDYRKRKALDRNLARSHCLHGYRGFSRAHRHFCTTERRHHGKVSRDIAYLRKLGIR